MLVKALALAVFSALIPGLPLRAGEAPPLSLAQAVDRALAQSPSLRAARAHGDAAGTRVGGARAAFFPRLDLHESVRHGDNPVYVFGSLLSQERFTADNFNVEQLNTPDALTNYTTQLTLGGTVFDGGRRILGIEAARSAQERSVEDRRLAEMMAVFDTARSYFAVEVAEAATLVAATMVSSTTAEVERLASLRSAGMATEADALTLKVHRSQVEERRLRAAAAARIARAELNRAMGEPLDATFTLTTPLAKLATEPSPELDLLEQSALGSHPLYRQAGIDFDLAQLERRRAHAAFLPSVSAGAAWEWDRPDFAGDAGSNWMVGLSLDFNLFSGFGDRQRLAEARFEESARRAAWDAAAAAAKLAVRTAVAEIENAHQRVAVGDETVAQASEARRVIEARYEAGLATMTDLLRARDMALDAETRRLEALYDQRMAWLKLEMAAGRLTADAEVLKP